MPPQKTVNVEELDHNQLQDEPDSQPNWRSSLLVPPNKDTGKNGNSSYLEKNSDFQDRLAEHNDLRRRIAALEAGDLEGFEFISDPNKKSSGRNPSVPGVVEVPEFPQRPEPIVPLPGNPNQSATSTNAPKFIKAKNEYELRDFKIIVKLGKGAFGNVYLVELDPRLNRSPNQGQPLVFAMKVIDKATIFS